MESSFTPIENMITSLASRQQNYPLREITLTRLALLINNKLLENRNKNLKNRGINDTLFNALLTLSSRETQSIQPSELSLALGSSRTNATRIADELEKRGWIERKESHNDRRCLHLHLTPAGQHFLDELLPAQHQSLINIWSGFSSEEQQQLEALYRNLLTRLDRLEK